MLTSIDDVIDVWKDRHAISGDLDDLIPTPGYDAETIESVSNQIGILLHPAFVSLLQAVKLDTISFKSLAFGGRSKYSQFLIEMNDGTYVHRAVENNFLVIGGAGAYSLILDNETGKVYVGDMYGDGQLVLIANSLEECIVIAAEIALEEWPCFKDRDEAMTIAGQYLKTQGIVNGHEFWACLIRDAV